MKKRKVILKFCKRASIYCTDFNGTVWFPYSKTKGKYGNRLTHPILRCLGHLTQLTLEVNVYDEVQISLQIYQTMQQRKNKVNK